MNIEFSFERKTFSSKKAGGRLLIMAVILLLIRVIISYSEYTNEIHHEIDVRIRKRNYPTIINDFSFGKIKSTQTAKFTVEAKSFSQYLVLDFDPAKNEPLSLFFCINFFAIGGIFYYGSRKSTNEKLFTPEFLKSISILYYYLSFMMILKLLQAKGFEAYIEDLSDNNVSYHAFEGFNIGQYTFLIFFLGFIINYLKKGLELQKDQDLTV